MIDSSSTPRREEKQPERSEPQAHVVESNIFSRQAPQAGPSTMRSDPFSTPGSDASPSQARDRVAEFLLSKEKVGTPLNRMEVEGLMSMLHKASESTEGMLMSLQHVFRTRIAINTAFALTYRNL